MSRSKTLIMPSMMYGTAWKKENTKNLVIAAVSSGFNGIDTACQPKHYREDLVGEALSQLYSTTRTRESLFLQTKFTPISGQDPNNIPYDPKSPVPDQVKQSIEKSLRNLRTDYIDSMLLHSPLNTHDKTMDAWKILEQYHNHGTLKQLGISNIYDIDQLKRIYSDSTIKPSVIQNRFYQDTSYDKEIRSFCKQQNIKYQSFWTLTANLHLIRDVRTLAVSKTLGATPQQVFFRCVMDLGIVPLSGTTDKEHMMQDLCVEKMDHVLDSLPHIKHVVE
ncbi:putative oxidoreductase [Acrasis kona]|uniref:Oxidoreductase n=1 Tax=Acrasis kona TaxID=1008807 RepID=A0AAW2Z6J7_9EUKA